MQCEQYKLTRLIAERLERMPNAEVLFSHRVAKYDEGANGVQVSVEGRSTSACSMPTISSAPMAAIPPCASG